MQISIRADAILLSMMIRVNPMELLRAMLRWLAWSKLLEPVPKKLSHVSGAMSDAARQPVPVPRSEQVPQNIGKTEPFLEKELRAAVPLYEGKPRPGPLAQAEALLSWLQRQYPPGAILCAADVELECYPLFLEQKGWRPRSWGSCKGVGKYLRELPGVKKVSPYIEAVDGVRERVRCYQLPSADVVDEAAVNRAA